MAITTNIDPGRDTILQNADSTGKVIDTPAGPPMPTEVLQAKINQLSSLEMAGLITPWQKSELDSLRGMLATQSKSERLTEQQRLMDIYNQKPSGYDTPAFDINSIISDQKASNAERNALIDEITKSQIGKATTSLDDQFAITRRKIMGEQALAGRGGSGAEAFVASNFDATKNKALSDAIAQITNQGTTGKLSALGDESAAIQRAREFGTQTALQAKQMSNAERLANVGVASGASNFGQSLDLQKQQLGQSERDAATNALLYGIGADEAKVLARKKADAEGPSTMDYINTAANAADAAYKIYSMFGKKGTTAA